MQKSIAIAQHTPDRNTDARRSKTRVFVHHKPVDPRAIERPKQRNEMPTQPSRYTTYHMNNNKICRTPKFLNNIVIHFHFLSTATTLGSHPFLRLLLLIVCCVCTVHYLQRYDRRQFHNNSNQITIRIISVGNESIVNSDELNKWMWK